VFRKERAVLSVSNPKKELTQAERGMRGAASRWGKPENRKWVRLDDLTLEERGVVLALVALARNRKAAGQ
jgi:hypothetical protein